VRYGEVKDEREKVMEHREKQKLHGKCTIWFLKEKGGDTLRLVDRWIGYEGVIHTWKAGRELEEVN